MQTVRLTGRHLDDRAPEVIEELCKAFGYEVRRRVADDHSEDPWLDHEVPLVAAIEEEVYREGEAALVACYEAISVALGLPRPDISKSLADGMGAMPLLASLDVLEKGIGGKPPKLPLDGKALTADEQKLLDRLVKGEVIEVRKVASRLASKSTMAAKLLALVERFGKGADIVARWLSGRIPVTVEATVREGVKLTEKDVETMGLPAEAAGIVKPTYIEHEAMEWARSNAGMYITKMNEAVRSQVRDMVWQAKLLRTSPEELARQLWHKFGDLNRDWRRIAITEIAQAYNNGYLATLPEGTFVVGMAAVDACKACREILHGNVLTLIAPPKKPTTEQLATCIWVGKSNYGRKRADWVAAVIMHPHCRCRWQRFHPKFQSVNAKGDVIMKPSEQVLAEGKAGRFTLPDGRVAAGVK